MKGNLVSTASGKLRNVAKNVSATFAGTYAACYTTMCTLAANNAGTGSGTFSGMQTTITEVINSAIAMLKAFIIPLATVACLVAILMMYLPGMSTKVTDRCKTVIWSCIATVVVAYALGGIFTLAQTIGQKIT